jgi:cytochrome c
LKDREIVVRLINIFSLCTTGFIFVAASGVLAAGDIAEGKRLARKCTTCHTLNKGGKNRLGPNLYNILGSPVASVKGYKYSKAMAASGIVWDEAAFTEFLTKPNKFLKGTKMSFGGVKKASQRADLLAFFNTLSDRAPSQLSIGDASQGKKLALKQCQICHSFGEGGKMVFGPNLFGVYGKPAGAVKGYNYSRALSASSLVWTDANLVEFLADPSQFIKGTKANFPGVKGVKQRADIVAYLKTLK